MDDESDDLSGLSDRELLERSARSQQDLTRWCRSLDRRVGRLEVWRTFLGGSLAAIGAIAWGMWEVLKEFKGEILQLVKR